MKNELNRTGYDKVSGYRLSSQVKIKTEVLRKYHTVVVSQKIRPMDYGIDVLFKIGVSLHCDELAASFEAHGLVCEDDDPAWNEPEVIALRDLAVRETDEYLKDMAQEKLEKIGIARDAHRVLQIEQESNGSFVLIECSFLVQRDPSIERGDGFVCEPKYAMNLEKLSFRIPTRQVHDTFIPLPDFTWDEKMQSVLLEEFGLRAVYCLPWFVHWLLDVGFDIKRTSLRNVERYSVILNTMWMRHQWRSDERRFTPPLAVMTHVLYPIALA